MKKWKRILLLLIIILIVFIGSLFWFPVPYVPVLGMLAYYEEFPQYMHDKVFLDAVEYVLNDYGEWYYRANNTIYINWRLAYDTYLLSNYTDKAFGHCDYKYPRSRFGDIGSFNQLPDNADLKGIKRFDE